LPSLTDYPRLTVRRETDSSRGLEDWPLAPAGRHVMSYRRAFNLTLRPGEVWETIRQVDRFQDWWGWLTELTVDGPSLQTGTVLSGVISPPLPYRMRVRIVLKTCLEPSLITAAVHGDLAGFAALRLTPDGTGTSASVAWSFEMMQPAMRVAALVASPVLRWGHDQIVNTTVAEFHRHLERPFAQRR
jgi:carbon monoxide dehydrogenase subunit G